MIASERWTLPSSLVKVHQSPFSRTISYPPTFLNSKDSGRLIAHFLGWKDFIAATKDFKSAAYSLEADGGSSEEDAGAEAEFAGAETGFLGAEAAFLGLPRPFKLPKPLGKSVMTPASASLMEMDGLAAMAVSFTGEVAGEAAGEAAGDEAKADDEEEDEFSFKVNFNFLTPEFPATSVISVGLVSLIWQYTPCTATTDRLYICKSDVLMFMFMFMFMFIKLCQTHSPIPP